MIVVSDNTAAYEDIVSYTDAGVFDWNAGGIGQVLEICLDASSNIYVGTSLYSSININKFNSEGTEIASTRIGDGVSNVSVYGVSLDTAGNVYACGWDQVGVLGSNAWKLPSDLSAVTNITSGTNYRADAIFVTEDNDIYLATRDPAKALIKFNSSLVEQWSKAIPASWGYLVKIAVTSTGGIITSWDKDVSTYGGLRYYYPDGTEGGVIESANDYTSIVIDTDDNIFVLRDNVIYKYTYSTTTDTFTQVVTGDWVTGVSAPGTDKFLALFLNNDTTILYSCGRYT